MSKIRRKSISMHGVQVFIIGLIYNIQKVDIVQIDKLPEILKVKIKDVVIFIQLLFYNVYFKKINKI